MKTERLRSSALTSGTMPNDPGWDLFFLVEKLVPDEIESIAEASIYARLDWQIAAAADLLFERPQTKQLDEAHSNYVYTN